MEAKTDIEFSLADEVTGEEVTLNGLTRNDTDKNIRKIFGTMDDFLLTSMSSQIDSLAFIKEGSTKRKEILAKFLDLELFDKKYKNSKEDAAELKAAIKLLEVIDHDEELKKLNKQLKDNEAATNKRVTECSLLKDSILHLTKEIEDLEDKINSAPTELIDIEKVRQFISGNEQKLLNLETDTTDKKRENKKNKRNVRKAKEFIKKFDIEILQSEQIAFENSSIDLKKILEEIEDQEDELKRKNKQVELLKEVPCGTEFSHCKFIKGAYEAKEQINIIELAIKNTEKIKEGIDKKIKSMKPEKINEEIDKFNKLVETTNKLENSIPADDLLIENMRSRKSIVQHELKDLRAKEKLYEENKEVIEDLGGVIQQKKEKETELSKLENELTYCESQMLNLYKSHGYFEQQIESIEEKQRNLENYQNDYEAYDLYGKCMHPNGIAYDIIKKSLPTINSEISKILANIVDFQVYFETEDNRLDIYIQQPDRDASPLEMASGAEKTVAAMAIRLAFTNISTLPKSQLFVLDEPGTALDEERMEGFVRILDITTSVFITVILLSHLDNLKDTADSIITIENTGGYANVCA